MKGERMPGPSTNNEAVVGHIDPGVGLALTGVRSRSTTAQWDLGDRLPRLDGQGPALPSHRDRADAAREMRRLHRSAKVRSTSRNAFGEINEAWVEAQAEARRGGAGRVRRDHRPAASTTLRAMPKAKFDEVGWSPVGEVPYREFMVTRILDSWAHEQDIRRALGRPGGRNGVGEAAIARPVRARHALRGGKTSRAAGRNARCCLP